MELQWPNWRMWWLHQVNTLHTGLNRNSEGWIGFSTYTHTIKQMDGSMIHFKKLQKSSIISLPQLLAGLATRVIKTFCFSVSSLPPPPLHCNHLIWPQQILQQGALYYHSLRPPKRNKWYTHTVQARKAQTQVPKRSERVFLRFGRGQKECSDR